MLESDGIRRTFSETALPNLEKDFYQKDPNERISNGITGGDDANLSRQKSSQYGGRGPKISVSKFTVTEQSGGDGGSGKVSKVAVIRNKPGQDLKVRSVTSSLSTLARKSFVNPSRSSSPNHVKQIDVESGGDSDSGDNVKVTASPKLILAKQLFLNNEPPALDGKSQTVRRRNTLTGRKTKRPLSALLGRSASTFNDGSPVVPAIPKSFSTDQLPSLVQQQSPLEKRPEMPMSKSSDRLQTSIPEPRKKDELWSNFRTLDGEYHKYVVAIIIVVLALTY